MRLMSRNVNQPAQGILTLFHLLADLKQTPRTGWLDRGIAPLQVESVADHSLAVALLAWVCAMERQSEGTALDPTRVALLALVHDLAEAVTGDGAPYDADAIPGDHDPEARRAFLQRRHIRGEANAAAKQDNEATAMRGLLESLPRSSGEALDGIWQELRLGASPEARFVKQIDRLETFLQSRRYLEEWPDAPMDSFRREVMETIDDPLLVAIRDAALASLQAPAIEP